MKSCKYYFDTEAKQNYDNVHAIYDHVGSQQVVNYINNDKTYAYCGRDVCVLCSGAGESGKSTIVKQMK